MRAEQPKGQNNLLHKLGMMSAAAGLLFSLYTTVQHTKDLVTLQLYNFNKGSREDIDEISLANAYEEFFQVQLPPYEVQRVGQQDIPMAAIHHEHERYRIIIDTTRTYPFIRQSDMNWLTRKRFPHQTKEDGFNHELTHILMFKIKDEMKTHTDLTVHEQSPYERLIAEGLAQYTSYVQASIPIPQEQHNIDSLLEKEDDFYLTFIHSMRVVGPIVAAQGIEEAIQKIYSAAPITTEEMRNPRKYHRRILHPDAQY